jgi:hypothetical protein
VWQAAASLDVARDPGYLDEAYKAGCRSLFLGLLLLHFLVAQRRATGEQGRCEDGA